MTSKAVIEKGLDRSWGYGTYRSPLDYDRQGTPVRQSAKISQCSGAYPGRCIDPNWAHRSGWTDCKCSSMADELCTQWSDPRLPESATVEWYQRRTNCPGPCANGVKFSRLIQKRLANWFWRGASQFLSLCLQLTLWARLKIALQDYLSALVLWIDASSGHHSAWSIVSVSLRLASMCSADVQSERKWGKRLRRVLETGIANCFENLKQISCLS